MGDITYNNDLINFFHSRGISIELCHVLSIMYLRDIFSMGSVNKFFNKVMMGDDNNLVTLYQRVSPFKLELSDYEQTVHLGKVNTLRYYFNHNIFCVHNINDYRSKKLTYTEILRMLFECVMDHFAHDTPNSESDINIINFTIRSMGPTQYNLIPDNVLRLAFEIDGVDNFSYAKCIRRIVF
jgi:hypothetical protein